ncbi:MAG: glycosyltransferase family 2 protein [Bacteroidetes bacterium]|nr:glycosyltransferase family 2 protein [Bacteroidota bacterium]
MPAVSILIPARNAAPWLAECLLSLQQQTLTDWECILVQDHSQDSSLDIMEIFATADARFRIVQNEGEGLIAANQTALKYAQGTCITRMDADDLMPGQRLEKMHLALQQAAPKTVVTGKVRFFPESALGTGTRFYQDWLNARCDLNDHWQWIWRECVIPSPCWMMRREELLEAGGFDSADYPEDYDMAFRLFRKNYTVVAVPEICHYWRQHGRRFSHSSHYSAEKFMALKWKYFSQIELPKFRQLILLGTGDKGKLLKNLLQQDQQPFQWASHQPHVAGNTIHGMTVQDLHSIPAGPDTCVISTLSSIDQFDAVYQTLAGKGVTVFRFC